MGSGPIHKVNSETEPSPSGSTRCSWTTIGGGLSFFKARVLSWKAATAASGAATVKDVSKVGIGWFNLTWACQNVQRNRKRRCFLAKNIINRYFCQCFAQLFFTISYSLWKDDTGQPADSRVLSPMNGRCWPSIRRSRGGTDRPIPALVRLRAQQAAPLHNLKEKQSCRLFG